MWTQKNTNLSAESIIFFNIKRWTVKVGFFDGKISVEPLCNASDFNASTDFVPSSVYQAELNII